MDANEILKKHEDANEMHFHEVDRRWVIEAMEEYGQLLLLKQCNVSCRLWSIHKLKNMDAIDKLIEGNHNAAELDRMAYAKENAINFNKWLFDNHFAPNQSFFWFDYTLSREDVRFFKLEELYDAYKRSLIV